MKALRFCMEYKVRRGLIANELIHILIGFITDDEVSIACYIDACGGAGCLWSSVGLDGKLRHHSSSSEDGKWNILCFTSVKVIVIPKGNHRRHGNLEVTLVNIM